MVPNEDVVSVVIRYRDGSASRRAEVPSIDITRQVVAIPANGGEVEEIPFDALKAVFFVRRAEDEHPPASDEKASVLSVEFSDGEVIRGQARSYNPSAAGFFLDPLDASKSDRIFVVSAAVVSIEVERF